MVHTAKDGQSVVPGARTEAYRGVREDALSTVLGEFARTLITDSPIQGILDHFVKRIVDVLPITSAGVTLISAGVAPHYVAATDDAALRFEELQCNIGEGPCVRAYETGLPVSIPDLRLAHQFPRFTPAAVTAGLAAVFTFPLHDGDGRLGALDLYRDTPGALDERDMAAAQTLADVAASYLLNARAREEVDIANEILQRNALHDPLTGLVNRPLLKDRIEHAASISTDSPTISAIFLLNIDGFRVINETHGTQLGDQLLQAIAGRVAAVLTPSDTLARLVADKFVILCENLDSTIAVDGIVNRVDAALSAPFVLVGADQPLAVTATIGVVFAGPASSMSNDLVSNADCSMREAKQKRYVHHQIIDLRVAPRKRARKSSTTAPPSTPTT